MFQRNPPGLFINYVYASTGQPASSQDITFSNIVSGSIILAHRYQQSQRPDLFAVAAIPVPASNAFEQSKANNEEKEPVGKSRKRKACTEHARHSSRLNVYRMGDLTGTMTRDYFKKYPSWKRRVTTLKNNLLEAIKNQIRAYALTQPDYTLGDEFVCHFQSTLRIKQADAKLMWEVSVKMDRYTCAKGKEYPLLFDDNQLDSLFRKMTIKKEKFQKLTDCLFETEADIVVKEFILLKKQNLQSTSTTVEINSQYQIETILESTNIYNRFIEIMENKIYYAIASAVSEVLNNVPVVTNSKRKISCILHITRTTDNYKCTEDFGTEDYRHNGSGRLIVPELEEKAEKIYKLHLTELNHSTQDFIEVTAEVKIITLGLTCPRPMSFVGAPTIALNALQPTHSAAPLSAANPTVSPQYFIPYTSIFTNAYMTFYTRINEEKQTASIGNGRQQLNRFTN
jgi:hypothetical protein